MTRLSALVDHFGWTLDPDFPNSFVGECPTHDNAYYGVFLDPDAVEFHFACHERHTRPPEVELLDDVPGVTAWAHVERDIPLRRESAVPSNPLARLALDRADLDSLPEPEPLIADTLDRRTVALLAGFHGSGKSFVALSWAASIATGTPWFGREVRKGRVLYIVGEGAYGIGQRLQAWESHHGVTIEPGDLTVLPEAVQLRDSVSRAALAEFVAAERFDLIVVDTLARSAVGVDENSARDLGEVIDGVERLKRANDGATVLLVHHTGKSGRVRGSSALEAAMDTVYMAYNDTGDRVFLDRTKRKDGPCEDSLTLVMTERDSSVVLVGENETEAVFEPEPVSGLKAAVQRIYNIHGVDFANSISVLKATLEDSTIPEGEAVSRATAYRYIKRLLTLEVLVNVGTQKTPKLRLVLDAAEKEGLAPTALARLPESPEASQPL